MLVKRESGATNRPPQPFKNILKKVKKSLQAVKISNNPCQNLTKPMEKLMIKNVLNKFGFVRVAFMASVGFPVVFASNAFAQLPAPAAPAAAPASNPVCSFVAQPEVIKESETTAMIATRI